MNHWLSKIKFLSNKVIVLYLAGLVLTVVSVNHSEVKSKAQATVLNRLLPHFTDLLAMNEGRIKPDPRRLMAMTLYYEKVTLYMPQMADGYGVLGFCYSQDGDLPRAVQAFQHAVELNPHYLWFHYNLGVLYLKQGQYTEAKEAFRRAVETKPALNQKIIDASAIYRQILTGAGQRNYPIKSGLVDGYRQSLNGLILSQHGIGNLAGMLAASTTALKLYPDAPDIYYFAGVAAYELNEYNRALVFLRECLRLKPDLEAAYSYIGLSLKAMGQEAASQETLRRSTLSQNTDDPLISLKHKIQPRIF